MSNAKEVLELFRRYDLNGDGVIDLPELSAVMKDIDSKWTDERCARLHDALDSSDDGKIEIDEFVEWVFGTNVDAADIFVEKPLMMLRLSGFGWRSRAELQTKLEPFGEIDLLHHVRGNPTESLVLFKTEEGARGAFAAQKGDMDGEPGGGHFKVSNQPDTPLYKETEAGFSNIQLIHLTPKVCTDGELKQMCPENFAVEFKDFVDKVAQALGDKHSTWISKADAMIKEGASVQSAARELRLLSLSLQFRQECKEDAAMWRRTMRVFAKGEIDFADPNKIVDALQELGGFILPGGGEAPTEPVVGARRPKKTNEDGWGMAAGIMAGGNQNSSVSLLTG